MNVDIIQFPDKKEVISLKKRYDFIVNVFEERYINNSDSEYNYTFNDKSEQLLFFPLFHKFHLLNWQTIDNFKNVLSFIYSNLDKNIVIHCRSGLHRSKMVKEAIYFMVNGYHNSTDGVNILIENCIDKHAMFPVTLPELETIMLNLKKEIDGKKEKELHNSNEA